MLASEQDRPDVARRRQQWAKYQTRIKPDRLVFIDETWTKTNMAPLRGWAARGQRLTTKVPHRRWCAQRMRSIKTMTFVAALRHDCIEAPWLLDGPINGQRFRLYVEKVLLPTLKSGNIVIMDNLGSHKGKTIRTAIRAAGAKLFFLPKSSPDLNPIEQVLGTPRFAHAKLKHRLRELAARTAEEVFQALGPLLDAFTPQECLNYMKNANYAQT